jgi:hypothetical protein
MGASWVKTAQDDYNVAPTNNFLTFTINVVSTVYILYDASIPTIDQPAWLTSEFTNTSTTITNSAGTTFNVWAMNVSAGTITLGSNLGAGSPTCAMYSVLIDPLA